MLTIFSLIVFDKKKDTVEIYTKENFKTSGKLFLLNCSNQKRTY